MVLRGRRSAKWHDRDASKVTLTRWGSPHQTKAGGCREGPCKQ